MAVVARMAFESAKRPCEKGEVRLSDDGFLQIEPSEEFLSEMARLEEEAVEKGRSISSGSAVALIVLGLAFAAAGWLIGRRGGRLRETIIAPQPIEDVKMFRDDQGRVHIKLTGVEIGWEAGETNLEESAALIHEYARQKGLLEQNCA